jgi:hypothetical protein
VAALVAAVLSLAGAAPAMANQILGADVSALGLPVSGYGSDGTFDGALALIDQACQSVGPQTVTLESGLTVAICQPASSNPEPLPQSDFSALGLPVTGVDTNGTYEAIKSICDFAGVPPQIVPVEPGLSVAICGPSN